MLYATRRLSMVIISVKYFRNPTSNNSYWPDTILLKGRAVTLIFNVATQMLCATCRINMVINFFEIFSKSDFK